MDGVAAGDTRAVVAILSPEVRFTSPFSQWHGRSQVTKVFAARNRVFDHLVIGDTLSGTGGSGAVLWDAEVDGHPVEACEVVSIIDGSIVSIDIFLRPAAVLDAVYRSMVAAWS